MKAGRCCGSDGKRGESELPFQHRLPPVSPNAAEVLGGQKHNTGQQQQACESRHSEVVVGISRPHQQGKL